MAGLHVPELPGSQGITEAAAGDGLQERGRAVLDEGSWAVEFLFDPSRDPQVGAIYEEGADVHEGSDERGDDDVQVQEVYGRGSYLIADGVLEMSLCIVDGSRRRRHRFDRGGRCRLCGAKR